MAGRPGDHVKPFKKGILGAGAERSFGGIMACWPLRQAFLKGGVAVIPRVVGERAPEPEPAGQEARLELADAAGRGGADPVGPRAADAPQPQVVLVLAEVRELHDRRPRLDRRPRERVAELVRADLDRAGAGRRA